MARPPAASTIHRLPPRRPRSRETPRAARHPARPGRPPPRGAPSSSGRAAPVATSRTMLLWPVGARRSRDRLPVGRPGRPAVEAVRVRELRELPWTRRNRSTRRSRLEQPQAGPAVALGAEDDDAAPVRRPGRLEVLGRVADGVRERVSLAALRGELPQLAQQVEHDLAPVPGEVEAELGPFAHPHRDRLAGLPDRLRLAAAPRKTRPAGRQTP